MKVVINGFGRIGRQFFQAALEQNLPVEFIINGISNPENAAYLLKYDSVYGKSKLSVHVSKGDLVIGKHKIKVLNERDPKKFPWKKLKVDLVIESTGKFRSKELAMAHVNAGAKRVLITATAKNVDALIVPGINSKTLKKEHKVISMASCTTNCVTPMFKIVDDVFGIKEGFMVTAHSYTSSQRLVDGTHKDFRRGRSAANNIVPTSTSAADAAAKVLPHLKGKLDGYALRVPVVDGSVVDLSIEVKKKPTVDKINNAFKKFSNGKLKGIVEYSKEPLVSTDILRNSHSCIFDSLLTKVRGNLINIVGWYDNEWGYSSRLVDIVRIIKKL
ncbi:type I glyceraldehyde-3-phosphate dehydrogenase [Nanoarchaeota archaeon]